MVYRYFDQLGSTDVTPSNTIVNKFQIDNFIGQTKC